MGVASAGRLLGTLAAEAIAHRDPTPRRDLPRRFETHEAAVYFATWRSLHLGRRSRVRRVRAGLCGYLWEVTPAE